MRLCGRFQQLRPGDGPDEIEKLVELVENGTLKEENGTFVVRGPEDAEMDDLSQRTDRPSMDMLDWEPNSHNTARIPISEFEDGYFSVVGLADMTSTESLLKVESGIPRHFNSLIGASPIAWYQEVLDGHTGFRLASIPRAGQLI